MRRVFAFTALASLAACASHAPPTALPVVADPAALSESPAASVTSAEVEQVPAPRDDGRLPSTALPRHYALTLSVDPAQERFQGQVTIDVDLPNATSHLVLHGRNLTIVDITATSGSTAVAGTATSRESKGGVTPEEIVLAFPAPLPAGRASLSITYDAPFDRELSGLYRVKEGERWYAFTQFESTAARRAFPCFDEPGYKVPFDLQITTPRGMIAVANTPETSRAEADDDGTSAAEPRRGLHQGSTRFAFATTPPLSTYLLAFAVGDFDVREGVKTPVPIRLVTVKGKARLGDTALDATAGLVKALGDYFALPYPFAKLDVVAVPDFAAGAMENPGLVTFREEYLLADPAHASVQAKRYDTVVIAHELAHMWFGDLVTMKWWNDVWLNEGFVTWMETKATDLWHPDYAEHLNAVVDSLRVMNTDALASARAVRQPVTSTSEIEEAFDEISYEKGAAVLGMIERWIGPETMQRGVRAYIKAHAWKNAEAADLLGALDRASGKDVSGMAATFLDRPGVPSVAVASSCTGGKLSLGLSQSAWHPLGVRAKETDGVPWRIPVCVHAAGAANDECTELSGARGSIVLGGDFCPAWAFPNAGESGYYRVSLPEATARTLARNVAQLDVPSRIGLMADLWAQTRAGGLGPEVLLGALPAFDHETDSHVLGELVHTLNAFDHALVDDATRPAFRAYVGARLSAAKRRLGWQPKGGETGDDALARALVLEALGGLAHDGATLNEAEAVAARWLKDSTSVDADVASVAVPLASIRAGLPRLGELRTAAANAKTPLDHVNALEAIGAFEDKATLERAWNFAVTDDVRQQDVSYVFRHAMSDTARARQFFPWLVAHWDAARAKMPAGYESYLVDVVRSACSDEELAAEVAYLGPRVKELEGAARPLAENTEAATACTALRKHGSAAVAKFFKR